MKNLKKIADDLHKTGRDPSFESFIAEQILTIKSSSEKEPCFSIVHQDITLDVWKNGHSYNLIKSVLPGAHKKSGKSFNKEMKKKELVEEILKIVEGFLD
jgi:hypothetical protein